MLSHSTGRRWRFGKAAFPISTARARPASPRV
jgi:hypothetical protein